MRLHSRLQQLVFGATAALALLSAGNTAQAQTLNLTARYKSLPNYVSAGGPQPAIALDVAATPQDSLGHYLPDGTAIQLDDPNQTGLLEIVDPVIYTFQGIATGNVRGTGSASSVTLRARWTTQEGENPPVTVSKTIVIVTEVDAGQAVNPTPGSGITAVTNPANITYKVDSPLFGGQVSGALTSWRNTGRLQFTPADDAQIFIKESYNDQAGWIGRTTFFGGNALIELNSYVLTGNTTADPASLYPSTNEFLTQWVAAHEIGHAIGLDHNTADRVSLMWPTIDSYYVLGTSGPTDDELVTLAQLYP